MYEKFSIIVLFVEIILINFIFCTENVINKNDKKLMNIPFFSLSMHIFCQYF
jgi:hypothetical protein